MHPHPITRYIGKCKQQTEIYRQNPNQNEPKRTNTRARAQQGPPQNQPRAKPQNTFSPRAPKS